MKVLVTGADGFIGSHLIEKLVRQGHEVTAFVYYNSMNSWGWLDYCHSDVEGQFEVFSGDIRDPHGVKQSMRNCDAVLHLAALISIPYSYYSPDSYVDTNIKGTLNIIQAARELELQKIIHTSTSEVYGTAKFVPITEEHSLSGQSPYSASKISADQIALSFFYSFGLPVTVVRPFNTYGPRQSARAVIPTIISQIASGQQKIALGSIFPTRDFSYIKDTINGFLSALNTDNGIGEVVNIGSNFEIAIGDLARLISDLMETKIDILADESRVRPKNSEVQRLWADNSKAKELFDWQPEYGGLDGLKKGLWETINWFQESKNLLAYKSDIYNV